MIKAVFFDAIDTLFKSYPSKKGMYVNIIEKVTGKRFTLDEVQRAWDAVFAETDAAAAMEKETGTHNMVWVGFNSNLLRQLGFVENVVEMGERLKQESWGNPENYRLFDDVRAAFEKLKSQGILLACVSNEDGYLPEFFKYFNIEGYCDFIVASELIGHEKPEPEIFRHALNLAGLQPHEVIFVGDSLTSDYFGSQAVGMKSLLLDRESRTKDDSIVTIKTLSEIEKYL